MARRVGKRKRPSKDKHVLSERWEMEDAVFDKYVLLTLSKFFSKGLIMSLDFPISRGKEANVYRATTPSGEYAAVKIYRIETTRFFKRQKYIIGDPRFDRVKKDRKSLAFSFAKKEFKNLKLCEAIGIDAPRAIECRRNILLMSFLGEKGDPYLPMYRFKPRQKFLKPILKKLKLMYENKFVHSDLSSYNVLVGDKPYLIDFAQGVVQEHPLFEEFFERDVRNILTYFKKKKDLEKVLDWIRE